MSKPTIKDVFDKMDGVFNMMDKIFDAVSPKDRVCEPEQGPSTNEDPSNHQYIPPPPLFREFTGNKEFTYKGTAYVLARTPIGTKVNRAASGIMPMHKTVFEIPGDVTVEQAKAILDYGTLRWENGIIHGKQVGEHELKLKIHNLTKI